MTTMMRADPSLIIKKIRWRRALGGKGFASPDALNSCVRGALERQRGKQSENVVSEEQCIISFGGPLGDNPDGLLSALVAKTQDSLGIAIRRISDKARMTGGTWFPI